MIGRQPLGQVEPLMISFVFLISWRLSGGIETPSMHLISISIEALAISWIGCSMVVIAGLTSRNISWLSKQTTAMSLPDAFQTIYAQVIGRKKNGVNVLILFNEVCDLFNEVILCLFVRKL